MRETKFRGKRISDGKWIEGVPVPNSLGKRTYILGLIMSDKISYSMNQLHEFCHEVIPESVGQYTGLKDKNGVEIYEGDIDKEDNGELSVIVYLKKAGSYCVMPLDIYVNEDYQNKKYFPELLYNFGYDLTFDNVIPEKYLSIVGNIYDNPELLEVEK